jgi:hypothetical protein
MKITLEIPDELVPAVESYIGTRSRTELDPATLNFNVIREFSGVDDYISHVVWQTLQDLNRRFPTPAMAAKMAVVKTLEAEIVQMAKPTVVKEKL